MNNKKTKQFIRIIDHFYIYTFKDGLFIYERTCGTLEAVKYRIKELEELGIVAVWRQNQVINNAYY